MRWRNLRHPILPKRRRRRRRRLWSRTLQMILLTSLPRKLKHCLFLMGLTLEKEEEEETNASKLKEESGDAEDDFDDHDGDEESDGLVSQQSYPWEGVDRDYEFEELLGWVFNILREKNPELARDRRRTVMRPPQVLHEGT